MGCPAVSVLERSTDHTVSNDCCAEQYGCTCKVCGHVQPRIIGQDRQVQADVLRSKYLCSTSQTKLSSGRNSELGIQASAVEYDTWNFMSKVLEDPTRYGFQNATCIGAGCVWWDNYHPTSAFHRLMAREMVPHLAVFNVW